MSTSALIIVDVQYDFCEGGSLAVPHGNDIIPVINSLRSRVAFDTVVLTQDWHPSGHWSFASSHPGNDVFNTIPLPSGSGVQVLWPDHCVQGTRGAEFHSDLVTKMDSDLVVQKGTNPSIDSYSGFFDNEKANKTALDDLLKARNVSRVYVCGLATDFCVQFTAKDAIGLGYDTYLIEDASRGISEQGCKTALEQFLAMGGKVVQAADIQ